MRDEKSRRHYSRYCHRDIGRWRWRRQSGSRQYGISANVGRRKWRKYKALMAFSGCIDSLVRPRALIDRKCCINTYAAATNPHRTRITRNNAGLCWNSIHFNESHIIQFNARSPIHHCFHCRINMFRVVAISRNTLRDMLHFARDGFISMIVSQQLLH